MLLIICICFNYGLNEGVMSSHCRCSKIAEPGVQDERESREDGVKEVTGIDMYKIIGQTKRLRVF
jgi:hypothetical protein